ncbi:MAG: hypothetical protein KDD60_10540 [Bdellovibrionales bacterium]|nr:hypothetical protein [Bdellovibrionales bacterium]
MQDESYRGKLIRLVTFLGGIYFFLEFLLPESILNSIGVSEAHSQISNGFIVVGSMAIGLGIINLMLVHGTRLAFRRKNWVFSAALLFGLLVMMTITILDWTISANVTELSQSLTSLRNFSSQIVTDSKEEKAGVPHRTQRVEALISAAQSRKAEALRKVAEIRKKLETQLSATEQKLFETTEQGFHEIAQNISDSTTSDMLQDDDALLRYGVALGELGLAFQKVLYAEYEHSTVRLSWLFLYEGLYVALGSAMFSLLGVYIAAAAYRAFRVKSFESFLMMAAASIVMLGQIPFYEYISMHLPAARQWLLETPNSAAFRAIKIGASIAGLVMAFRMWFSIESEKFTPQKGKH